MSLALGIRQASSTSRCPPRAGKSPAGPGPRPHPTLLASPLSRAGLGLIVLCDGLAHGGQRQQPTGLGAGKVPWGLCSQEVWSAPGCHPAGPPRPTKSWQPLGAAAQLLARASGHPARPGVGRSVLGVWSRRSVGLSAMRCGRQEEERARGVARSPRLRPLRARGIPGTPTQASVGSSGLLLQTCGPGPRCAVWGRRAAGHVPAPRGTYPPGALCAASAPGFGS